MGGGDGGSTGRIETRPAINEIRCWDERRRGRGSEVLGDDGDAGTDAVMEGAVERFEGESGIGDAERERTGGEHDTARDRDTLGNVFGDVAGRIGVRRGDWATLLFFVIAEAVTQEERDFCGEPKGS